MKYSRHNKGIRLFGKKVRDLRKKKNLTQEEFAADCNLEYSQISRIERGVINTSISNVFIMAEVLGVTPKELFEFE